MGKKGERVAKDKTAALEEEARNAARKAGEHGEEEYQCAGILEQDFAELCARAGFQEVPKVLPRPHPSASAAAEEPDPLVEKEWQNSLMRIQGKYAYFRPAIQVELEHEDPKSTREIFIRGWRLEDKMLGVLAKCLPALSHLQTIRLWKVGLTDLSLLSLIAVLPNCPTVKVLSLEGNPLPERSFYKLIGEDSTLAHVSLRNNNIDDEATSLIAQALSSLRTSNKTLASINLSYNFITDVGAASLANALRLNRSLLSLSLSHNRIGDEGAVKLAEILAPFALTHSEIVERRRLLLEKESQEPCRMPQRYSESKADRPASHASSTTLDKLQPVKTGKATGKKKEPAKKEEKGQGGGGAAPQAGGAAQTKKEEVKQAKKAIPAPEQKAARGKGTKSGNKDRRSQITEVEALEPTETVNPLLELAEHSDGKVFLPGNRVLIYLNLIRNQISELGLKAFVTAVEQQASKAPSSGGKGPAGLLHLALGKNKFPSDSKSFARIQELMAPRDPLPKSAKTPEDEQGSTA
ncbi:leucine-rich repeat-containing protein 71 isoform X1 [Sphaerodactylus townsendi]|uniref:leucine-rich repeat-containing protein 71 isoform X1 n=1 Tax=Sphaerodactylus townsendi TaxID=933632 RepID=UPI0020264637|nr:leucine-rich repeat-containing protein 71 isoform X1 [Sphaerodactylus townsendi]